jgi:hypothetical protein
MQAIQIPATLEGASTLKEQGCMSIRFHSQEMTEEQQLILLQQKGKFGWLMFRENQFIEKDIPEVDAEGIKKKTPSQRLRNVLYVEWDQGDKSMNEDSYYTKRMEEFINQVKKGLNV